MIRKQNKKSAFLLFIIVIFLSQTGCQQKKVTNYRIPGDGGLLSQEPCGPPCFYGITPGVTNRDEAENILNNSLQLTNCSDYEEEGPGGMSCDGITGIRFDEASFVIGIGYYIRDEVTLKDLIEKYGEPNYVATITAGRHKDFVTVMRLYYPKIDMSVLTKEQEGDLFTISPDTFIDTVTYMTNYNGTKTDSLDQEWRGYGEYFMGAGP